MKKLEMPHLIVGIVIIALVVGAYLLPLSIFVAPSVMYANTGEEVTYDLIYYNQRDTTMDYYSKAWIGDDLVGVSSVAYGLEPGEYVDGTLTFDTPSTPGTYTVEVYSYYTESWGDGGWDEQVDVTLVVSSATETPTETATATATATPDPCEGKTCDPYCDGSTYRYNGYCEDGECIYQKEYNSAQCIEETPTETATPTSTETITPTETGTPYDNGDDGDMSGILWWGGGIIAVLLVLLVALRSRK